MSLHRLEAAPPPELARALARFEEQFRYPLGPGRSFRIEHGADYPRFFRAIGAGACFVAERHGRVLGVVGAALRSLLLPGGDERRVLYVGDVKVAPGARGGRTLLQLLEAARDWVGRRTDAAFAVVMDGTAAVPTRYTGRLGIPRFVELGRIVVLRLGTAGQAEPGRGWLATAEHGATCYRRLCAGRYAGVGGDPAERSAMEPLWLVAPGDRACGRLEDTRRAKRLIDDDGHEMQSAHLSGFACRDPRAGVELLRVAAWHAEQRGLPALFVAVPAAEAAAFGELLAGSTAVLAPATVFGAGLEPGPLWNVDTAEI